MFELNFNDTQVQALSFLRHQLAIIEPAVYRIQYPDIQYDRLVPVATDGWEWAKAVTFTSLDTVGRAQWIHEMANDFPVADVVREQFEVGIDMNGIGYRYSLPEIAYGMRIPGFNLGQERAEAARRAWEEFADDVAFRGNTDKGWKGLINQTSGVDTIDAASVGDQNGGTDSPYWVHKNTEQIMEDFNSGLTNIYAESLQVEMADTVILPLAELLRLSKMQMTGISMTVLEWLKKYNVYTFRTGQPLDIVSVRGLETADDAGGGRAVFYRRNPDVLKMHIPMPHRFLPVFQEKVLQFLVPGIGRLGPLEIRRPMAVRYLDGISAPPA